MPPVSKVLGNDAKVDPFMLVKWYMLMHVVQDWHTKLTAVSGDMRRSEEKTTKDMMSFAHQLMMMSKMLKANLNDIGRLESRLAVIEGTPTPSLSLSSRLWRSVVLAAQQESLCCLARRELHAGSSGGRGRRRLPLKIWGECHQWLCG